MPATASPKTLIIGLDVGDGRLIRDWAESGYLPTLRSLIARGAWGWLESPARHLHVSAWPSLYTGTLPGEHGVYYTFQPAPGLQGYRKFSGDQYGRPTFWRMLSEAGVRCTVFDAPYTHPETGFRGVQVFEWGTWAHYWHPMSTPPEILRRLRKACGDYPLGMEANGVGFGALDPGMMERRLVEAAVAKAEAASWLLSDAPCDLFFVAFGETHPAAHYCWPSASQGERDGAADLTPLRRVYEAVDRGIATLLARAGEVTLFVVSGDGVGPNQAAWHLLPAVLQRLGFLSSSDVGGEPVSAKDRDGRKVQPGWRDPLKAVRDLIPKDVRRQLARHVPVRLREALMRRVDLGGIRWSDTRAYCLPTDLEGCIRINLRGREPAGIVTEGAEYRAICDELAAALLEIVDPATGQPAVREVIRTDEIFPGPRRAYLPDLIVLWAERGGMTQVASNRIGTVASPSPDARTGTHAPTAFVLAHGPSIEPGSVIEGAHVVDLPSTILSRFAVPLPDHLGGTPWQTPPSRRTAASIT